MTGTTSGTITVQRQNAGGTPITADATIIVNLSTTSGGGIFRDTGDTTTITSVSIPNGSSSSSFKYKDSAVGTPTITAASAGLTSATQGETVNNSAVAGLIFTNVTVAGSSTTITCVGTIGTTYTCTTATGGANNSILEAKVAFSNASAVATAFSAVSQVIDVTYTGKSSTFGPDPVNVPGSATTSTETASVGRTGSGQAKITVTFSRPGGGTWTAVLQTP